MSQVWTSETNKEGSGSRFALKNKERVNEMLSYSMTDPTSSTKQCTRPPHTHAHRDTLNTNSYTNSYRRG